MRVPILEYQGQTFYGEVILTKDQLQKLKDRLLKVDEFAFDTETNTLKVQAPGYLELVGMSICFGINDVYYIPVGHYFDDNQLPVDYVIDELKPVFEREGIRLIGWNIKYDLHVIKTLGIDFKTKDIWDGMIATFDLDEEAPKGLKDTTRRIYGYEQPKIETILATVTPEEKKIYGLKTSNKPPFQLVRIDKASPYALQDAFWTWRHYVDYQQDAIEREGYSKIFKKQMEFLLVLFNMERRGVKIDVNKLKEMQKMAEKDLDDLAYQIYELAGVRFDIASSQQLAELLFGYEKKNKKGEFVGNKDILRVSFKFPVVKETDKGMPSTDEDALEQILNLDYKRKEKKVGQEVVRLILKYKKLMKLKTAFMDGILEDLYPDGKVHPTFNLGGAKSGRLSCSDPNLQQLPRPLEEPSEPNREKFADEESYKREYEKYLLEKEEYDFWKRYEIRSLMIPDNENEVIIASDFSNLELRVLAHFSKDPALLDAFDPKYNNGHGKDVHGNTAVVMFGLDCDPDECKKKYPKERQVGKTINFLLVYGGSPRALAQTLGVDEETATKYYNLYFEKFKGVKDFMHSQKKLAKRYGYVLTAIGRKKRLPYINSDNIKMKSYNERLAVNSPIQGTASDIAMFAQLKIEKNKRLKELGCKMLLQVHDELVFSCPRENADEAISIIKECMEHPFSKELNVPLVADADYADNYADAK